VALAALAQEPEQIGLDATIKTNGRRRLAPTNFSRSKTSTMSPWVMSSSSSSMSTVGTRKRAVVVGAINGTGDALGNIRRQ
jgi:hypothetical protein